MEGLWSIDKLTLFLAFFLPGFISLQVYRLFIAGDDSDLPKKLPAIVAYSSFHYAVFGWVLLIAKGVYLTVAAYIIVLIIPLFWPFAILILRDDARWKPVFRSRSKFIAAMLKPEATPWDRVFTNDQFVRITLKDGGFVGGFLAKGSAVSTYPNDEQLYIRNEYEIDQVTGQFGERIESTGVLVNGDEIKIIELIELKTTKEQ